MRRLDDWLDHYVLYTENSEPSILYRKWAGISILAACMQRKCYVLWGGYEEYIYPNLYVVLVGPTGARKGTAMGQALRFLNTPALNIQIAVDSTSRASLIRDFSQAKQDYVAADGSVIPHSSLMVAAPEFTVFLGYNNVQMLTDLIDWYDSVKNPWIHKTLKYDAIKIVAPLLNILGATTPDLFKSAISTEALGGGLIGRMLLIYSPRKEKTIANAFETDEEKGLRIALSQDLIEMSLMGGKWQISPRCLEYYEDWYENKFKEEDECADPRFEGFFNRKPTTIRKVAMILSVSRGEDKVISLADLKRAMTMVEEVESKMYFCLQGVGKNQYARVMNSMMAQVMSKGSISQSELLYMFRDEVTKFEFLNILSAMEAFKFCYIYSNTGEIMYNKEFNNGKTADRKAIQ